MHERLLSSETVAQVHALRRRGLSHQKIARRLGIAKASVYKVLHNKRHETRNWYLGLNPGEQPLAEALRCRCGARVLVLPCRTCGWGGPPVPLPRRTRRGAATSRGGRPARGKRADRPKRDE